LSLGLLRERQDWRTAVTDYTNMYSNETFSPLKPDAQLQAIELSAVGARLGADLTPENVALPGLRFTTAFMLTYEDSPLGVIAYVDPSAFASWPITRPTRRCARSAGTICPSPGGRAADAATWLSVTSRRSGQSH
jgi:hypothetical protein